MPLMKGSPLGPYEIVAPLGAGGMGEVYKARDTRLERTVAIKVLPAHIAERDDLRARFEREARAVSSLNHPHICASYDIGSHDGVSFMVLEHLEGETIAERIKKGGLFPRRAASPRPSSTPRLFRPCGGTAACPCRASSEACPNRAVPCRLFARPARRSRDARS
jgi:serine/threonine protein kinase